MCAVIRNSAIAVLLALGATFMLHVLPAFAETVEEPTGYRMEEYRAPVPATLHGAHVVSTQEAEKLWREGGAIFVDVLPRPPKPELPEGTLWQEPPHSDIPGSIWIADVGFGGLTPEMENFYRDSLDALTGGDSSRPLLIYCRANCWMSWNAAKRAIGWGYSNVIWYPGGIEDWEAARLPLESRKPTRPAGQE